MNPDASRTRISSTAWQVVTRRSVAVWLAAALFCLPLSRPLLAVAAEMKPCGEIVTRGASRVDGEEAMSGGTIFSDSTITTEPNATATISLGRLGRIELLPDSGLKLSFGEAGVAGSLASGGVTVSLPAGVPGSVTTGDISVATSGEEAALFSVTAQEDATVISALGGQVRLRASGRTQQLAAGQSVSVARDGLSLNTSPAQTAGAQSLSGGKKAAIFLGIGGAIAILLIALTRGDNNNQAPSGGCVTILSPTGNPNPCL